jgi:hypothetical protein
MDINQKIIEQLTLQNVNDIMAILKTHEGRRFIMWLFSECGQDNTSFTRDSRTYFNEGMRNVALIVKFEALKSGTEGMNLLHKAESEYFSLKANIRQELEGKEQNRK